MSALPPSDREYALKKEEIDIAQEELKLKKIANPILAILVVGAVALTGHLIRRPYIDYMDTFA